MPYSICIVSGDGPSSSDLLNHLKGAFDAETFTLAHHALKRLRSKPANLVVVDSELPDMPGMAFLRVLRETEYGQKLAVIFLSEAKTAESVAEAFSLDTDDYLVKPIDPREMGARINAILRRKNERHEQHWGGELSIGPIRIDPDQRLCVVNGKRIELRPLEFQLLDILMRKAGRVLSRSYLLNTVWGMDGSENLRVVDSAVSRLRRSLGRQAGTLIETVSKMGYCFRDVS
jgi:DNA-binding response OmpR family regulator